MGKISDKTKQKIIDQFHDGKTLGEIALNLGITIMEVGSVLKQFFQSKEDLEEEKRSNLPVYELWQKGKTLKQIALDLGISLDEATILLREQGAKMLESKKATSLSKIKLAKEQLKKAAIQINDGSTLKVVDLLQEALMMEFQQWDLYYGYKEEIRGLCRGPIMEHFEEHAKDEADHIDLLQRYLVSMNVKPTKERHKIPHLEEVTSEKIIALQLKHELEAVEKYKEILNAMGEVNNPLKFEIEGILMKEQEHAQDLQLLIDQRKLEE